VAPVERTARDSGGFTRRPRFDQMARLWNTNDADSVAMMGGMRRSRIRA
jgi:hypothetical protein